MLHGLGSDDIWFLDCSMQYHNISCLVCQDKLFASIATKCYDGSSRASAGCNLQLQVQFHIMKLISESET